MPVSSLVRPPKAVNQMNADPGRSASKPITVGLPPFSAYIFLASATMSAGLEVSSCSGVTPALSSTRLLAINADGWKNCGTA